MRTILKVFLPYSLLAGIGIAIWVSSYHPQAEPVMSADAVPIESLACSACGQDVLVEKAVVRGQGNNKRYYCDGRCAANDSLAPQEPDSSQDTSSHPAADVEAAAQETRSQVPIDPVCKMEVSPAWGFEIHHEGKSYYFCTKYCRDAFATAPDDYLGDRCLVCKQLNDPATVKTATYMGKTYRLCGAAHREQFKADPAGFFMHRMWGIPSWMYYLSIAIVLVISFGLFELLERITRKNSSAPQLSLSAGAAAAPPAGQANRIDLLRNSLMHFLATSREFRFCCQAFFVFMFFVVIAAGLFGNQNPALNIAPLLTWTIWWGGLVLLIMFAGKAWCFVCPWDAVAGWMEKLSFLRKSDEGLGLNLKWPKALRNIVLATILFVGLTWIELGFGVTMKPRVTAYLGILMLLLAVVSAFVFEKKGFCRYACLVGRVSGLYAMFSGIEVRAKDAAECRTCHGKECVHGSTTAYGCPTFLFPGYLSSNTYCIQCGECIQACPTGNLTVNLRPWASDLVSQHHPRTDEAYLALLMLSITGFHGLTMTENWARLSNWITAQFSLGNLISFSLGMASLMLAPILIYAFLVWASYEFGKKSLREKGVSYHNLFVRYAYALLPIALFYHLAHNLEHLLMEGPKVVSLASDPFGWGWNLFGTLGLSIPPLVSLDVLWILQIALVLVGHVYSLWVSQRTSIHLFGDHRSAFRSQLPMLLGMICFSVFSLWLLKQPMEMRTSAM